MARFTPFQTSFIIDRIFVDIMSYRTLLQRIAWGCASPGAFSAPVA